MELNLVRRDWHLLGEIRRYLVRRMYEMPTRLANDGG